MPHHKIQYLVYADDTARNSNLEWSFADRYINGFAYSYDKREAFAIAKKAAKNCNFQFVVLAVPIPKRDKDKLCTAWIVDA